MNKRDLVVIGGGAGGLVVASVAAQLGLDVVLIEKQPQLGGDCLHFGCVPSKALLKAAHVAHTLRNAGDYGYSIDVPQTDMAAINASVQKAVSTIQVHDSHERFESFGCEVITGEAQFVSTDSVKVGERIISAKHFVIATGSSAWIPDIQGLENADFVTNEEIFNLEKLPEHLLILGGGPVGVEMAQAFARFGSQVTLIEKAERILPNSDPEIAETLMQVFASEGIELALNKTVTAIESDEAGTKVIMQDGSAVRGDKLLVAIGRRPVIDGLDLENAGVEFSARGVTVNAKMQTTNHRIYACGDVTGLMPFTHVAEQQAGVIIANMIFKIPKRMDYRVVPSVIYTEPECAQVGVSVAETLGDKNIEIVRFEMSELDRAVAEHTTTGFIRLIVKKGRLVGAHMIGPHAGDVIHELVLAIQGKMKLSKITAMVHAYPSYAQVNRRAASVYFRDKLFSKGTKRLVGFLNRWFS
jgi:pyruvate/2-oxoglutarate dehydrogenase complex dihydrolipoamide dehydrogenase (E3) component